MDGGRRRLDGKIALITGVGGRARPGRRRAVRRARAPASSSPTSPTAPTTVDAIDGRRRRGDVRPPRRRRRRQRARPPSTTPSTRSAGSTCSTTTPASRPADDDGPTNTGDETWRQVLDVNVTGVARCCRHGIPAHARRRGGGSIVNVASFVAHMGAATPQIAYTASKGAVLSMTREIAVIYARQGIRANALCPGPVLTPLLAKFLVRRRQAPAPPRARPDGPLRRGRSRSPTARCSWPPTSRRS